MQGRQNIDPNLSKLNLPMVVSGGANLGSAVVLTCLASRARWVSSWQLSSVDVVPNDLLLIIFRCSRNIPKGRMKRMTFPTGN
jgi:hypothetical protein